MMMSGTAGLAILASLSRAAGRHIGVLSPARCSPSSWRSSMRFTSARKGTATVSGKWSLPKRCNCKDADGKELGRTCPKLTGATTGQWAIAPGFPRPAASGNFGGSALLPRATLMRPAPRCGT